MSLFSIRGNIFERVFWYKLWARQALTWGQKYDVAFLRDVNDSIYWCYWTLFPYKWEDERSRYYVNTYTNNTLDFRIATLHLNLYSTWKRLYVDSFPVTSVETELDYVSLCKK